MAKTKISFENENSSSCSLSIFSNFCVVLLVLRSSLIVSKIDLVPLRTVDVVVRNNIFIHQF